ncbi:MAG: sulfur carrier protein ThiS [Chloroflexi bacterium]|nr:sulfur carrier protein ThiS [Chloroflexota bacterium]MCL5108032.1 sulfur carrier protein ThiS [Chloroflexota bacterium]
MRLIVNGKEIVLDGEITVLDFLRAKGLQERVVAVEHNRIWLRQEHWSGTALADGDRLEIVHIMAGG